MRLPFKNSKGHPSAAIARQAPEAALALWVAVLTALVAVLAGEISFGTDDTPRLLQRLLPALPITASWIFLALFDTQPLRRELKIAIRAVAPGGLALGALALIVPATLGLAAAAAITVICSLPTLLGTALLLRNHRARPLHCYAAGWILLAFSVTLILAASAGFKAAASVDACMVAALGAVILWSIAVAETLSTRRARTDEAHRRAVASARKYRHVYYSVPISLMSIDVKGHVLRWNDQADKAFGMALHGGRLNPISVLIGDDETDNLLRAVRKIGHYRLELAWPVGNRTLTYSVDAIAAGADIELSFADVSERSELAAAMEYMAHHDHLTQCLNRRGLERAIDALVPKITAARPASFIYVDLDRFKAINDVFGHAAGDAIVIEIARRLSDHLPAGSMVSRMGGDEFMAVLVGVGLEEAKSQASQIMKLLARESFDFDGLQINVEASIGVIQAAPGMQTRELLAYADEACAQSKRSGRGRITALEPDDELLDNFQAEKRYGTQLKFRLPTERMRIYAQPIVPLQRDIEVMSYEVLLRTEDERGRIESPARLIAAAERQGAMAAIDRFVLGRTVNHLAEHPAHTRSLGFVSVNLSGMSLNDDRFVNDAIALLRDHRSVASKICLEITESVALYDIGSTRRFVEEMRALGAMIALDDFGAGYTSFAYLKDLPANLLKIDGQFIVGLGRGAKNQGIVRAIQQVGRELGMQCLAEWVEDEATLAKLIELDVDYAQGFVFSKAKPLEAWLDESIDLSPLLERLT